MRSYANIPSSLHFSTCSSPPPTQASIPTSEAASAPWSSSPVSTDYSLPTRQPLSQRTSYSTALLLSIGSLYWTPLLLFIPLFWFGMHLFESLNTKTILAGITDIATTTLFLLAWAPINNNYSLTTGTINGLKQLTNLQILKPTTTQQIRTITLRLLILLQTLRLFLIGPLEKHTPPPSSQPSSPSANGYPNGPQSSTSPCRSSSPTTSPQPTDRATTGSFSQSSSCLSQPAHKQF